MITCFAREKVEDHELARTAGGDRKALDAAITKLGLDYQIATRLTSWLAISETVDVDPGDPTRREDVPQELPYGMSVEGLGLRSASVGGPGAPLPPPMAAPMAMAPKMDAMPMGGAMAPPAPPSGGRRMRKKSKGGIVSRLLGRGRGEEEDKKAELSESAPMQGGGAPEPAAPEAAEAPSELYRLEERDMAEDMDDEMAEGAAPMRSMTQAGAIPSNLAAGVVVSKKGETWIVEIMPALDRISASVTSSGSIIARPR